MSTLTIKQRILINVVLSLFFACINVLMVYAQPGFDPSPLPKANKYVVRKFFGIERVGPELNFDESTVAVLADDITLKDIDLNISRNSFKHLVIIANKLTIGSNNSIFLRSNSKEASSLVIICRKLKFSSNSRFSFSGISSKLDSFISEQRIGKIEIIDSTSGHHRSREGGTFEDLPPPNFYTGGFGSQLLIAAESVEVDRDLYGDLKKEYLRFEGDLLDRMIRDSASSQDANMHPIYEKMKGLLQKDYSDELSEVIYKVRIPENYEEPSTTIMTEQIKKKFLQLTDLYLENVPNSDLVAFLLNQDHVSNKPKSPYKNLRPYLVEMFQDIYPPVNTDSIMARWGNLPLRISGIVPKFDYLRPVKRTIKFALNTGYTVTDHFTRSLFPAGLDVLGISTGFNALRVLPVNQQNLFSQWAVEWLKYKKSQALQAKILPNRQKYFNILREITEMPLYQLDGPFDEQFNSIKSEMIGYLSEAQNLVGVQSLILGDQAAGVNVSVLSQGIPAKYYAHPSDILLTGLHSEHSWYYGLLQQVSTPQRVTRLILQGILQVDPLTNSSINEALEKEFGANLESEPLSGLKYEIEGVTGDGIKRFDALVNGGLINVTIDIEPTTEAIERIMFRLATIGLPYYLKWTLPGHPTQQGIFGPLQLSINRRTSGLIHVDGKKIVNGEKTSAAHVRYVRTSKGRILPFKEVRVAPKSSVTLNDFDLENDEKLVDVPDLGIRYEEKDFNSTASNFLVINEGSIFNQLTVKNIIQATITIPGSGLTYPVESIEVFVTLIDPDTQAQRPIAHFLLSPNNLPNSTVVIPTISLSTNTYRITGQVHLIGGIVQLKPQDSKLPDITISEDDINY